jgi:hypothetical protein
MTERAPLVDFVRELSLTPGRGKSAKSGIAVSFDNGAVVHLDPSDPRERIWGEVLESLRESRQPAYVELDVATGRITNLLLPQKYKVVELRQGSKGDDLQIEFDRSHALHYLRRDHPRFKELRNLLEDAAKKDRSLLVTESLETSGLVDVRFAEGGR